MSVPATATERQRTIKDVVPSMEEIQAYEVQNKEEARLIRDLKRSRQRMDGGGPAKAEEPAKGKAK